MARENKNGMFLKKGFTLLLVSILLVQTFCLFVDNFSQATDVGGAWQRPLTQMWQRHGISVLGMHVLFPVNGSTAPVGQRGTFVTNSSDGESWSPVTSVSANTFDFEDENIWWNDTHFSHVCTDASEHTYWRLGAFSSNGTLNWVQSEQIAIDVVGQTFNRPATAMDSDGNAFVAYDYSPDATNFVINVTKNSKVDGTWTTAVGFPKNLTHMTICGSNSEVAIVALDSGRMYVSWRNQTGLKLMGALFDGSSFSDVETITTGAVSTYSIVAVGDDIYLVTVKANIITLFKRTYGVGWDAGSTVQDASNAGKPVLSRVGSSGNLLCLWLNITTDCVYYKNYIDAVWDGSATLFLNLSSTPISGDVGFSCAYESDTDGAVGFYYSTGASLPYTFNYDVAYALVNVPEYDYVDSQTDLDSHADHGTHSSFSAQKATDWTNDTLTEANTNTTVLNNSENFVDNNSSDVDSHANHGLSSNFTGQQDSNVLYNDTLTEANTAGTTSDVFTDGFEDGTFNKWDGNGVTTWGDGATFMATNSSPGAPWVTHSGTYMADADSNDDGNLTSDSINAAGMQAIGISFWYMNDDGDGNDFYFFVFDGVNWDIITALGDSGTTDEDVWLRYTWITTDSQYFDATFRFGFTASFGSNEGGFIDDVVVNMTTNNNYELDMEFQWTTADYDETNEYVCIRTGSTFGAENILVKYRNGGTWNTLVTLTTVNTWYNTTLAIASETLTLQFLGATEASDTVQSTWQIECSLIHVWSYGLNYELDLEEQFTSANFSRTSEELCIRMGAMDAEILSVQWWNTTDSTWTTIIASLSADAWNNVSVTAYLTSATFTIKFIDGTTTSDEAQGTWDKDACLLRTYDIANVAPTVADLRLSLISDTVNITTGITVNTWYDWEANITDTETLNDISTITIRIANDPALAISTDSASYNESSVYWFRYTNTTDAWEWYSGASWTATSDWIDGNCTNPTKTELNGFYLFRVKLSKVARYSSAWEFAALATDSVSNTATKTFTGISIAKYDEIVMITTTHTWTDIEVGDTNILVDEGTILFNVSCNYNFKLQAQSNSSWVESDDGYKIGIGNITIHKDTLGSAISLTITYADIGGLTNLNTLIANTQHSFKLWATIPEDTAYDKTYAYKCQVQVEDA